jgi:hypothetical protein
MVRSVEMVVIPWSLSAHDMDDNAPDRARLGRLRIALTGEMRLQAVRQHGQRTSTASDLARTGG